MSRSAPMTLEEYSAWLDKPQGEPAPPEESFGDLLSADMVRILSDWIREHPEEALAAAAGESAASRDDFNAAILAGEPDAEVAKRFGVLQSSVRTRRTRLRQAGKMPPARHWEAHELLAVASAKRGEIAEVARGLGRTYRTVVQRRSEIRRAVRERLGQE